jgi:D-alanyl-D-alanine carboxypeptidase (penicillin-binding protein 5/6)
LEQEIRDYEYNSDRESRRRQRIKEMKRKKKQQELVRKYLIVGIVAIAIVVVLIGFGIHKIISAHRQSKVGFDGNVIMTDSLVSSGASEAVSNELEYVETVCITTVGGKSNTAPLNAKADSSTTYLNSSVISENGIFIDVAEERILAQNGANERISPASMTKILTILTAAEHITDLDDTFEITIDITDYSYSNDCSNTGFSVGEKVTVRDLFYGTILPSGADAALGLAIYTAGSHEAFVELMNEKIEELGLSQSSHFTNCVGIYNEDHYSTVYDMAVMLKAACDNSFCREVLSAHTYTTSSTEQHPDGITISNWFLRRIEDKDTNGEVLCAKTGFVVQSGNCAASLSIGNDGKEYICVTAHSTSSWRCIYDHVALYQQFLPSS